jgi:hypothetical protein
MNLAVGKRSTVTLGMVFRSTRLSVTDDCPIRVSFIYAGSFSWPFLCVILRAFTTTRVLPAASSTISSIIARLQTARPSCPLVHLLNVIYRNANSSFTEERPRVAQALKAGYLME